MNSIVVSLLLIACVVAIDEGQDKIIYGTDDRKEFYETAAVTQALVSKSIAAIFSSGDFIDCTNTSNCELAGTSNSLCDTEKFAGQPTSGSCSVTLIDTNKVLTAGHCITSETDCNDMRIVFNYYYESAGNLATITSDDVFTCSKYYSIYSTPAWFVDYAIIVLDRDVSSTRTPLSIAKKGDPLNADGTMLTMAGFPGGLPMKILEEASPYADNNNVFNGISIHDYYFSESDTFGGNSGSGVFDVATGKIWGILSSGNQDYVYNDTGDCNMDNVVPNATEFGGQSEIIVYPFHAASLHACTSNADCSPFPHSDCSAGFCQTSTALPANCVAAGTTWDASPNCCMPAENDNSTLCREFLAADVFCQSKYFKWSPSSRTCSASNITWNSDECGTCTCGLDICGTNLTAVLSEAEFIKCIADSEDVCIFNTSDAGGDGDGNGTDNNSSSGNGSSPASFVLASLPLALLCFVLNFQ